MEQHVFILLFLTGVIPLVLSVPRLYYLIQQGKNWTDAQAYCRAQYTDLAIIKSSDDLVQLQKEIQRQQFSSMAWIGMYSDIKYWRWSLGNEPLGNVTGWLPGQPDNAMGVYYCAATNPLGWVDLDCNDLNSFLCFDDTKTGSQKYIFFSNSMTWYEAQAYCRTHYTDLASARNSTEISIIMGRIYYQTWFGLFRDGWKWTDQTKFSTISWMSGKPNNALGDENCGYLMNGQVSDAQCSDILAFFCYTDPGITEKQQIVRVKVQSTQDVNDPAVKVAILEQIQQKLMDHGMPGNITVKWREQPGGKVFHKEKENNTT